jgi:hypothetical protein
MSEQTEREKLIKEIKKIYQVPGGNCCGPAESLADFILEDRKRIVAPLLKEYTDAERDMYGSFDLLYNDVQTTLKNAGIGE